MHFFTIYAFKYLFAARKSMFLFLFGILSLHASEASGQCDIEVSGVMAYCNSFKGNVNNTIPGFFIGFRIQSNDGDTLNVIDLAGNVPMNLGKRINDINTEFEPSDTSRMKVKIAGGIDSLEYWYFGPFTDGDSFNIVLVDPDGICDTVFVAAGTFTCQGQDPSACTADVPLYFLDFSQSEWTIGGGGGINENVDAVFLIMQRSRVATCCQTGNQRCFEFIITLDEDDIGLLIDDVGNGSTGGQIFADSLNGFACGTSQNNTWPYFQENGNSADDPLCLGDADEWIVLSCKQGNNVTGVSIGTVGELNVLPEYVYSDCTVDLEVLNATSATWTSTDDPNLNNIINFTPNNLIATFHYNEELYGPITSCDGDTFTYFVAGYPDNTCLPPNTLLYDTTYVVVYPGYSVLIDSTCIGANDSVLLQATITGTTLDCDFTFIWSTGDTTQSIIVPAIDSQYSIRVFREDLDSLVRDCSPAVDIIDVEDKAIICLPNLTAACVSELPPSNPDTIEVAGCGIDPIVTTFDLSNEGSGCSQDSLIISRYYIVDYDGDTINTLLDRDTCIQLFIYVDNIPPVINCPPNITIGCTDSTLPGDTGGFATGSDNCSSVVINYSDVTNAGTCPQQSTIIRTWMATDDCGNTSTCNQTIAVRDNTPPVISCPANLTIQCTESTLPSNTGNASAVDICDPMLTITYTDVLSVGSCPSTITRRWRATDDCGNSSTCNQIITLIDTQAPQIVCPSDVTILCSENTNPVNTGFATGTDNCDASLSITHTNSIISESCPRIISRIWTISDDCGNLATCIQTITAIDSLPPTINCPANVILQCGSNTLPAQTGTSTATDNCDPIVAVTYSDSIADGTCPGEQIISRTWIATDDCGNYNTCVQIITLSDTIPPVIICPANITIECLESTLPSNTGIGLANDNCDLEVLPLYTDDILSGDCPQEMVITRQWIATDDCGNSTTCTQLITVEDNVAPSIVCPPDITINYTEVTLPANTGTADGSDNCDTALIFTYSDSLPMTCPELNIITRTWTATDDCGNSSTCQQFILIEDHGEICGSVEDDLGATLDSVLIKLYADININGVFDAGDTLVSMEMTDTSGQYCFTDLKPCQYILVEVQPVTYSDLYDYDFTADPDGNDSLDGPDNEIPVDLLQGETDSDNNFIDIVCPTLLPVIPPDTICSGDSVEFVTVPLNPGPLTYTWNFGSGATPASGIGLGPHTVSYVTTTNNQTGSAIITLTVSKDGCPDLTGQVSSIDVNPYPNAAINGSTSNLCYFTDRTFQPVATEIPGATYTWTFGSNAVPSTASGYGPHVVYYTVSGPKTVKLVIQPNEAGAQCPDSSSISFNVTNCPGNITGTVKSVTGAGIQGVNIRLYADANEDGIADNNTVIRSVFSTANGSYSMVSLTPASYVIVQMQPPLWITVDDEDTSNDGDEVANIDSLDNLIPSTLRPSEIDAHNIFTESAIPGNISGSVFIDLDADEVPDNGEGVAGVMIGCYNDNNKDGQPDTSTPLDTVITGALGNFSFTTIPIGNYVIEKSQLPGYVSLMDFDATDDQDSVANTNTNDNLIPVTLHNQENDQHNYFIDQYECTAYVTNSNDSGPGSLRYIIECAVAGDTIRFDSALAGQTITITSEKIEISKNLMVISECVPRIMIASEVPGLFDIGVNAVVGFESLDISSGISGNPGAAFYNFGVLKLTDIRIYRHPLLPANEYLINNSQGSEMIITGACSINEN